MQIVDALVECPVTESFRVRQLAGMFDVPLEDKLTRRFQVELPSEEDDWQVGMIVGDSGSGKSTVARAAYDHRLVQRFAWKRGQALIDGFGISLSTRTITQTLVAVGLSSPVVWCQPYHCLSTGQQFRADVARGMLSRRKLIAFDEFTSVVDRTSARFGSMALRRAIDRGQISKKLVAVTCHLDVIDWLRPDWVLDMTSGKLTRRCLRRPRLQLSIHRCSRDLWPLFASHHYLDGQLNPAARCYIGLVEGQPAVFAATLNNFRKNHLRISRLVTLPTYQGIGLGGRMLDELSQHLTNEGATHIHISGSHPAVVAHCNRSTRWEFRKLLKTGRQRSGIYSDNSHWKTSTGRAVATFRFVGGSESD
ncbi:glutamine ABC transporter ATP-binding protein [Bremerella volcania]|uniref:Glutamine ABC transporter ATP-binding protein n=1 Tax=Bremerella volcania TaxID=2527984 RepID=A0A518C8A9_9BACT|nr:GNAT family N-acetyltransferase [Bremerella volcania]QDU75468.1 glutamine ABC transporter ATP-binding protein [Bremerella volcania]